MLNVFKKCLSHRKRLMERVEPDFKPIEIGMPKVVTRLDEKTGRIVNDVEFDFDYSPDANLRVSDFALENLLAAGVQLNETSLTGTGFHSADSAINAVESSIVEPNKN